MGGGVGVEGYFAAHHTPQEALEEIVLGRPKA